MHYCATKTDSGFTGINVGPGIFGTVSLIETVGTRPNIGIVSLTFSGSGGNPSYTTNTNVYGHYSVVVNEGWTGAITATDPDNNIFTPETIIISTPITTSITGQDFECWKPPIGIPMPEFGIREKAGPVPDLWTGTVDGFYYIDNTHPSATDTANTNGYPDKPRLTIPLNLPAGAVVQVRGAYGSLPVCPSWAGTAQSPVFIEGVGLPRFSISFTVYNDAGGIGG